MVPQVKHWKRHDLTFYFVLFIIDIDRFFVLGRICFFVRVQLLQKQLQRKLLAHVFLKKKILADVHVPLLKYHITYRWWTFHDYLCVFLCCSLHLFSVIVRVRWWHVGPTMSCRALD